jgi:hypothetical protein
MVAVALPRRRCQLTKHFQLGVFIGSGPIVTLTNLWVPPPTPILTGITRFLVMTLLRLV